MGWIVYDKQGNLVKYYKKPGPAKAAVTRYHKARDAGGWSYPESWACCTYRDYEGVLLGLKGAELKLWQFCNTKNG